MKKSEIKKLSNMSAGELLKEVAAEKDKLRSMKFDLAAGKVKNISAIRELKKDIARMLTFANKKHDN